MNKLRIAMVQPALKGHEDRGTGVYARHLFEALNTREDVTAEIVTDMKHMASFDVIHYPYFDPFFLTLPIRLPKPSVITVHDLIPFNFPDYFPAGTRGKIKWLIQRFSLSIKSAVITDSFASKNDIVRLTKIKPDFVHVIYLGVGKEFKVLTPDETKKQLTALDIPQKYILYVGDINYNKNIPGLIQAFSHISDAHPDIELVLTGKGFTIPTPQLDEIDTLIHTLGLEKRLKKIGHVTTEQLVALYNAATVYVQPSFAEGFGLPVLEAMACGTPVISARTASLPEIVSDSALLVDPYSIHDMAKAMESTISSEALRGDLTANGLQRVRQFTWEKCAQETIKIYEKVKNR